MRALNCEEQHFVSGCGHHETRFGPFGAAVGGIAGAGVYAYNQKMNHQPISPGALVTATAVGALGGFASPAAAIWGANAAMGGAIVQSVFEKTGH
jgi:ABC-type branched-subunit amino acid transport system permease subunit